MGLYLVQEILCIFAGHALLHCTAARRQELRSLPDWRDLNFCLEIEKLCWYCWYLAIALIVFALDGVCSKWRATLCRKTSPKLGRVYVWCRMLIRGWKVLVASQSRSLLLCVSLISVEWFFCLKLTYLVSEWKVIDMRPLINSAHPCHGHGRSTCLSLASFHSQACSCEQRWVPWQGLEAYPPWITNCC